MPILNVGERLNTPSGRLDLAADVIGVMVHPKDKTGRLRRRSALAETLFGMSDRDDEPEAVMQVKRWFRRAGGFKTASESDPYRKQQDEVLHQIPKMLNVGVALDLVWAMDVHHREKLPGGASLNKALAILRDPWAPGEPMIIENRLISEGGWIKRQGVSCFNLYRPPLLVPGDAAQAGRWVATRSTSGGAAA